MIDARAWTASVLHSALLWDSALRFYKVDTSLDHITETLTQFLYKKCDLHTFSISLL